MIISVSYYIGEIKQYQYFRDLIELNNFLNKFIDIFITDFETLEITFYRGEDEKRVLKGMKIEEEKQERKK